MLDLICLFIGRIVLGIGALTILYILLYFIKKIIWDNFLCYYFYIFKHLIPCFQYDEHWFIQIQDRMKNVLSKKGCWCKRKGRLVTLYIPMYPIGARKSYYLIKKK